MVQTNISEYKCIQSRCYAIQTAAEGITILLNLFYIRFLANFRKLFNRQIRFTYIYYYVTGRIILHGAEYIF